MKPIYVALSTIAVLAILIISIFLYTSNTAVGYEQSLNQANSDIQVQENRQYNLIMQLVQTVEQSGLYEGSVQTDITKLRSQAQSGDIQQANISLKAISENYPQLQAVANYSQLMTEMSLSENLVTQAKTNYNQTVRDYKVFTSRQPFHAILIASGYQIQDFQYLTFQDTSLPTNLFGK